MIKKLCAKDAWELFEAKEFDKAKFAWDEIIKDESIPENYSGLAYTLTALKEFEEARSIYQRLWSEEKSHIWLHQLCMVEREAGQYEKAFEFIDREYSLISSDNIVAIAANLYERGKLFQLLGEIQKSLHVANECWEYSKKCDDLIMKGCSQRLLGDVYKEIGVFHQFLAYYFKAADYFVEADDLIGSNEIFRLLQELGYSFVIRHALPNDAEGLHHAHMRSIQEICSGDYSDEQISAWGKRPFDLEMRLNAIVEDFVLVAEIDSQIVGFAHLKKWKENDHSEIVGLYLTKEATGKGIAKVLLELLKRESLESGHSKIRLSSTITAKNFYLSQGFKIVKDQIYVTIGGVKGEAIPMEFVF